VRTIYGLTIEIVAIQKARRLKSRQFKSKSPAIKIAAIQTKSACADYRDLNLQPAQAGFGCVAAISIAGAGQPFPVNRSSPYDRPDRHHP
jgi:hypothetical protein